MEKTSKVTLDHNAAMLILMILMIFQESPESGGRGEPGKTVNNNTKSGAKRRRSGIDMVGGGRAPVLANGQVSAGL